MKFKRFLARIISNKLLMIVIASIAVLALVLGLSLGLTLPIKSVEAEGEVILLRGETYVAGLTLKSTTRAGLVHREAVTPDMISGLDASSPGVKKVTISYKGRTVKKSIRVLGEDEVELRLRGEMLSIYRPNDPFATNGIFDLYNKSTGKIIRSAPVRTSSCSPAFTTALSGNYHISLYYNERLSVPYPYTVLEVIDSVSASGKIFLEEGKPLSAGSDMFGNVTMSIKYLDGKETKISLRDFGVEIVRLEERDGEQVAILRYLGMEASCPVAFYSGSVLNVERLFLGVDKQIYLVGESPDPDTLSLHVWYAVHGEEGFVGERDVRVTAEMIEADPFDSPGEYVLTVKYKDKSSNTVVTVIDESYAEEITRLSVRWGDSASGALRVGADLDFEGAELSVEYGGGYRVEKVPLTADMVSGYQKNKAGVQTLTLTYEGFDDTMEVTVSDLDSDEVTNLIRLVGWDEDTIWSDDEIWIPENARIEAEVGYGAEIIQIPLTDEKVVISGFTPHLLDPQTITIIYDGKYELEMPNFRIEDDRNLRVKSIDADNAMIVVYQGDEFSFDTVMLTITYNDRSTERRTFASICAEGGKLDGTYDLTKTESYPVRVFYSEVYSPFIWIRVEGEEGLHPIGIELITPEEGLTFRKGEAFDFQASGMTVKLIYSDQSREDITSTLSPARNVVGFSSAQVGSNQEADVFYVDANGRTRTAGFVYSVVE